MSNVSVETLRTLRAQAEELLKHAGKDLSSFLNDDGLTFLRTPESPRRANDVNVTTTCSCLMALALTDQFKNVYTDGDWKGQATAAFDKLVRAPWMSSGLTENNAFTTTLVIRTLGFLLEADVPSVSSKSEIKEWDLNLGITDFPRLIERLQTRKDTESQFLWRSLSDDAHDAINKWKSRQSVRPSTRRLLTLEIQRIIESGWIYESSRFPKVSAKTKADLRRDLLAYDRAAVNRKLVREAYQKIFAKPKMRSLREIARTMAFDEKNFTINKYPPTAAVIYWFIDGVRRARLPLPGKYWQNLCRWATTEFNRQRSLVIAQHDAMMDPVAMAMSACLCARLRVISDIIKPGATKLGANAKHLELLPSEIELKHSITELFKKQAHGIWPKYFPLFHYQEAGSNFCFTFELLEAILVEFGQSDTGLLDDKAFIIGLERAVAWCKKNRLNWKECIGWNSGGSIDTLQKGQPESWATAVVHMFLWELKDVLSRRIQKLLLEKYNARPYSSSPQLKELLDIDILQKHAPFGLKQILRDRIISSHRNQNEQTLRRNRSEAFRSALLFGPPGTSKTKLTEAVANELKWWLIQIDPSDFLREGLDQIYNEADRIFEDLMDLSGVVVLFDEMDALVQTRDSAVRLETSAQFLTTFMLPKLTRLHDKGQIVYFMATNFQDRFDAAIKRPGRFDLLLCMGPPTLKEKLKHFDKFLREDSSPLSKKAARLIADRLKGRFRTSAQLEFYTFSEFKNLVRQLGNDITAITSKLETMTSDTFATFVNDDSQFIYLRLRDLEPLRKLIPEAQTLGDLKQLDISREQLRAQRIEVTKVIQYLLDLQESRFPPD
jgi:ATPase family associated with various cellular activities (AAA)